MDDGSESSGSHTTIGESAGLNHTAGVPGVVIVGGQTILETHTKEATDEEEEDIYGPPPEQQESDEEEVGEDSPEKPKRKTKPSKSTSPSRQSRTSGSKSSTKSASSYSPSVDTDSEGLDVENQ